MRRMVSLSLVLFSLLPSGAFAQNTPRIAIVPLNYVNVSKAEADALTALLETAFVQTESFSVIEQTRINEILQAQEFSLQDCTDEKCAVRVGQLLSAEQIVVGMVSRLGTKYVANAKIIEVETGQNLKADKVEATTLESLADQVELLAYKLSGLTLARGEERIMASAFAEVFIETSPTGAEVMVNGSPKGRSPLLVLKTPVGKVLIEARLGNMYGARELEVKGGGLAELSLALSETLGRVFVRTDQAHSILTIDGKEWGPIAAGLVKDIPLGEHELILRSHGSFWQGTVRVFADRTELVEASPIAVGDLAYSLPEGVKLEIEGKDYRRTAYGRGVVPDIPVGIYRILITGEQFLAYSEEFQLSRGETRKLEPKLTFTEEYLKDLAGEKQEKLRKAKIAELQQELETLRVSVVEKEGIGKKYRRAGWLSFTGGILAAGIDVLLYLQGKSLMDIYKSADTTLAADDARARMKPFVLGFNIALISGGACMAAAPVLWLVGPRTAALRSEMGNVRQQLEALNQEVE